MATFGDVLAFAPKHDALTDDVKGRLEGVWGNLPATEIGTKGVFGLVKELTTVLPDPSYDNTARYAVATAVHETLEGFGFTNPATAAPEQILNVRVERTYREMGTLRELLQALLDNPRDHAEILPYIYRHHQVQAVNGKSRGLWIIPNGAGGIDLDQTVDYVLQLAQPHATAQWEFRGRRPVTLDRALGINRRALIHPFTQRGVQGPDANGFELADVDIELIEGLLWASATGHPAWPSQIDVYECTEQILTTPLPRRWTRILEQYREAKAANDGNRLVNPYWPDGVQMDTVLNLAIHFGFAAAQPVVTNYESLLKRASRGSGSFSGTRTVVTGVYNTLDISGTRAEVRGAIVLSGGIISGTRVEGTIYVPPGVSIDMTGTRVEVNVITKSWEWLARHVA